MDFSSLVLMEREKETNFLVRELGSYEVGDGADYITKLYYNGEVVTLIFDTKRDVEEWEYSAIFDLFDTSSFEKCGYKIEDIDEEYNPTWKLEFEYDDEHSVVQERLNEICEIIEEEMGKVFTAIEGKEDEYK